MNKRYCCILHKLKMLMIVYCHIDEHDISASKQNLPQSLSRPVSIHDNARSGP